MKKLIPIIIVGILILSGAGTLALTPNAINTQKKIEANLSFSQPVIQETMDNKYLSITVDGATSYLLEGGKPVLPKTVKTFELDFGVKNVDVSVTPHNVRTQIISDELRPASKMMPLTTIATSSSKIKVNKKTAVYQQQKLFPSAWYEYDVGCGLNDNREHVTFVSVNLFPVRYAPANNKVHYAEKLDVTLTYDEPDGNPFPATNTQDLAVIAPSEFTDGLQRLVDHKNDHGVDTFLKTTEGIYDEYQGVDKPEQIKYFIKDAIETEGIHYVLLVGGLKSLIYAPRRDDMNQGSQGWHVPVRYNNLFDKPEHPLQEEEIYDPGVVTDLYYMDIYREGGLFEDWDPNSDGIFAAWARPGVPNDTGLDLYPDVYVGRLACRNQQELNAVVDKIIAYENGGVDPSWFNKMTVISGDGFLDQEDLDIQWDVTELPEGKYTIYAQSMNPEEDTGPMDVINVTLDRDQETSLSFNHNDHLRINEYPSSPIAEIVSVSEGDVLGNTDYTYTPSDGEAYGNSFTGWANVEYRNGVLHIRGKSYDPRPYGNVTSMHVWVENKDGDTVFSEWRNHTEMYYEGEWATGEKLLKGRAGALYYMPEEIERDILWTSNGKFTGQSDVIDAWSEGCGFIFLSGHGSPQVWADHLPGVPGNRQHGSVTGLSNVDYFHLPIFPMSKITNNGKLPVCVVGGCHNSQFNVTATSFINWFLGHISWTYVPTPECWSWWVVRMPERGAIASMGNTGLGYGRLGKDATAGGGDAWITTEFFVQYGTNGHHVLGDAYGQALTSYVSSFDMSDLQEGHAKTVEQWALLGDPSLQLGGNTT